MKVQRLNKIQKLYFGYEDIAKAFGISANSAKVTASRYFKQGILIRVKKNMYMKKDAWELANIEEKFQIANLGQVPSYISLATALGYYNITTQIQREYYESVAIKRTKGISLSGSVFRYLKISKDLYFGFHKQKDCFIATPEKALLDALYLMSYGRYSLDLSAIHRRKFDPDRIEEFANHYPSKTRRFLVNYGYLKTT